MPQTLSVSDAVELAVVERSGFVESRHAGVAISLAPDGSVVEEHGNTRALVLPRSTLKPLQAVGSLTAGAVLAGPEMGVAAASHSGTDRHATLVRDILDRVGLTEDALQCPPALPRHRETRRQFTRDDLPLTPIRHECSGKHAAMIAACAAAGFPTAGYLDPRHPIQAHVLDVVERLAGEKPALVATDGCGAPVPAISLEALARGFQRVGTASETSPFAMHRNAGALVAAVREHPWTIAGPGDPDTLFAQRLGVFAKTGAEGLIAAVAPDGTAIAVKTLDGSSRAGAVVALRLLVRAGAVDAAAATEMLTGLQLDVYGGGAVVGGIRPTVGAT